MCGCSWASELSVPRPCAVLPELLGFACRLFLHSFPCSPALCSAAVVTHWALDRPRRTVDEFSGCHDAVWLGHSRAAFCCSLLASAAVTPCCFQELLSHCYGFCSAGIPKKLLRGFVVPADWAGAVDYVQRDADYLQNHKHTNGGMKILITAMNFQVSTDKKRFFRLGGSSPRGAVRQDQVLWVQTY